MKFKRFIKLIEKAIDESKSPQNADRKNALQSFISAETKKLNDQLEFYKYQQESYKLKETKVKVPHYAQRLNKDLPPIPVEGLIEEKERYVI